MRHPRAVVPPPPQHAAQPDTLLSPPAPAHTRRISSPLQHARSSNGHVTPAGVDSSSHVDALPLLPASSPLATRTVRGAAAAVSPRSASTSSDDSGDGRSGRQHSAGTRGRRSPGSPLAPEDEERESLLLRIHDERDKGRLRGRVHYPGRRTCCAAVRRVDLALASLTVILNDVLTKLASVGSSSSRGATPLTRSAAPSTGATPQITPPKTVRKIPAARAADQFDPDGLEQQQRSAPSSPTSAWRVLAPIMFVVALVPLIALLRSFTPATPVAVDPFAEARAQHPMAVQRSLRGGFSDWSDDSTLLDLPKPPPPQPLIPDTVPFTVVSLLRPVSTDEELLYNKTNSSPEAYRVFFEKFTTQWLALISWQRLVPSSLILVFMDSTEVCEKFTAREQFKDIRCLPVPCVHPDYSKPLMDCIFHSAHAHARTELIAFVNGDIILHPHLTRIINGTVSRLAARAAQGGSASFKSGGAPSGAVQRLPSWSAPLSPQFLLITRRTNYKMRGELFDEHKDEGIVDKIIYEAGKQKKTKKFNPVDEGYAIDLMVYPKSVLNYLNYDPSTRLNPSVARLYPAGYNLSSPSSDIRPTGAPEALNFAPFLAGVWRWDNWFLSQMIVHPSVTVVEATAPTLLVHVIPPSHREEKHEVRFGSPYNDKLARGLLHANEIFMGHTKNADALLKGDCNPDCSLESNPTDVIIARYKRSTVAIHQVHGGPTWMAPPEEDSMGRSIGNWLAVVYASSHDEALLHNWLCWAQRHEFSNVMFLAQDQHIARVLDRAGMSVEIWKDAPDRSPDKHESPPFLRWMSRNLHQMMFSHSMVVTSVRTLWLAGGHSLFHHFHFGPQDRNKFIQVFLRRQGDDAGATVDGDPNRPAYETSVMVLKKEDGARSFFGDLCACLDRVTLDKGWIRKNPPEESWKVWDHCLNYDVMNKHRDKLSHAALDTREVLHAVKYLREKDPQLHGVLPKILDLGTHQLPSSEEWAAYKQWGMVSTPLSPQDPPPVEVDFARESTLPEANRTVFPPLPNCLPVSFVPEVAPPTSPALRRGSALLPGAPIVQPVVLTIIVVAASNPGGLRRLIDQLQRSAPSFGRERVNLLVQIDMPSPSASSDVTTAWKEVKKACKSISWTSGAFFCEETPEHRGEVGQWTGWEPLGDPSDARQLTLVLDDTSEVSSVWYNWIRHASSAYYVSPAQFDPFMLGISLAPAPSEILGEPDEAFISASGEFIPPPPPLAPEHAVVAPQSPVRTPASLLVESRYVHNVSSPYTHHLYRYQMLGHAGSLFFPGHWKAFQEWLVEKRFNARTGRGDAPPPAAAAGDSPSSSAGSNGGGFEPCVPYLLSNLRWRANPEKHWNQWLLRFMYERGLYALFANFPEGQALMRSSSSSDSSASGTPLLEDEGPGSESRRLLSYFPQLRTLPLFDQRFHRERSGLASSLAIRRTILAGPPPSEGGLDRCFVMSEAKRLAWVRAQEQAEVKKKLDEAAAKLAALAAPVTTEGAAPAATPA